MSSPIESMLWSAIVDLASRDVCDVSISDLTRLRGIRLTGSHPQMELHGNGVMDRPPPIGIGSHQVVAFKAVTAGRYRVDFLLVIHETRLLAVECDGHEWHERTKQQASGDRARDRDLLRTGILTARYTGSDIASDPDGCAADLLDIVVSQGTAAMGIRSSIRRVRRAALGRRPPLDVDGDYIAGAMSEIG